MIPNFPRGTILATATVLLLCGCASQAIKLCPYAAILADTASLTAFREGAQGDAAGALYTVNLTGVSTDCSFDKTQGETYSSLDLTFNATRKPSAQGANYTVPYFIAVTQGDRILSKRSFTVSFTFAPGAASAGFTDEIAMTQIQLANGQQPTDYQILAGLQLTPAQQDYNKKIGLYAP